MNIRILINAFYDFQSQRISMANKLKIKKDGKEQKENKNNQNYELLEDERNIYITNILKKIVKNEIKD